MPYFPYPTDVSWSYHIPTMLCVKFKVSVPYKLEFVELLGIVSGCTDWSIAHNKDHGVLQLL